MRKLIIPVFVVALILANPTEEHSKTAKNLNNSVKTTAQTAKAQEQTVEPVKEEKVLAPETPPVQPPQASCESEIAKYNWDQPTALAVAQAESGLNPQSVNDNPSTGDYSIGCFQVNIYGANALTRPSEAELKDPTINVAWAHKIYSHNGNSFLGQWGVCRDKVSCY